MEKDLEEKLNTIIEDIKKIKSDVAVNKTNIVYGFEEAKKERAVIKKRIDDTYNAVDGFVKIVTKLEDEFEIFKKDLNEIKKVIKDKLGIDLFQHDAN